MKKVFILVSMELNKVNEFQSKDYEVFSTFKRAIDAMTYKLENESAENVVYDDCSPYTEHKNSLVTYTNNGFKKRMYIREEKINNWSY